VFSKSKIFKFLKRDCDIIPVAEIINGKIEFFSKHQRFLIATESSKYLYIFFCRYYLKMTYFICILNRDTEIENSKIKFLSVNQLKKGLYI
jgi:hypothetical protein